ncbi:MAG TPA: hypothetical protein VFZ64_17435 [Nocardioidaceae bacterium]
MRTFAIALASIGIASVGLAAPAQAAPDHFTYGNCVSNNVIEPSDGLAGPFKTNPQGTYTGAPNAWEKSGGHSRFAGGIGCMGF